MEEKYLNSVNRLAYVYAMVDMGKIKGWVSSHLLGLMEEAWLIT